MCRLWCFQSELNHQGSDLRNGLIPWCVHDMTEFLGYDEEQEVKPRERKHAMVVYPGTGGRLYLSLASF